MLLHGTYVLADTREPTSLAALVHWLRDVGIAAKVEVQRGGMHNRTKYISLTAL